jgi:hypothetical protein
MSARGRTSAYPLPKAHFPLEAGINPAQSSLPMPLKSEPVAISAILLSDSSIVEQGTQKRSVIGCFEQISLPKLPSPYGRFWVTAWISNIVGTLSEMTLTTRIQEKSGHVVFSSGTKIQFPRETSFDNTVTLAFSTPIDGITFPRTGIYTIVVLLNGEEVGKRDFNVLEQQPNPNP